MSSLHTSSVRKGGGGGGGHSHNSAVGRLIEKRVSCRTNDWLK